MYTLHYQNTPLQCMAAGAAAQFAVQPVPSDAEVLAHERQITNMNPLLLFLSLVFGLMPFNRSDSKSNVVQDYLLMALVPAFYFACFFTVNFYGFGIYQLPTCNSICRLSNTLFMHVGCFLYVSVYFLTLLRRKTFFLQFDQSLREIDELIAKCAKVADDKMKLPQKKHLYYVTWAFVLTLFAFDLAFDVDHVISVYGQYFFISVMVITFPFFVGSIAQGMFIYYVSVISHRFTELNSFFNKINMEFDKKNAPIAIFDIESDAKKGLKGGIDSELASGKLKKQTDNDDAKVIISSRNNKPSNDGGSNDDNGNGNDNDSDDDDLDDDDNEVEEEEEYAQKTRGNDGSVTAADCTHLHDLLMKRFRLLTHTHSHTSESNLPDLFKLHDRILSLSVLVNAEFGAQCVPYMATCFAITIFGIFLETKVIFIVGGQSQLMDHVICIYVLWSFSTIVVGYLVLRLCCNTNAHSKDSAMIVHEIMQKKPSFMLGNDLYYNKMKAFTLQFLHWEGYFQFNGIGLFALDYTFIFSTVSAATSYLIVLLQFDMTAILKGEGLTPSIASQS